MGLRAARRRLVGGITAGVYPTSPAPEVEYLLALSEAPIIVCEDQEQLDKVLRGREPAAAPAPIDRHRSARPAPLRPQRPARFDEVGRAGPAGQRGRAAAAAASAGPPRSTTSA
jgi:long-chain acyl-CoA synthetase